MDDMERKLKEYFDQAAPDRAFYEKLLTLEEKAAPRRSHNPRRYLLPVAAALAAAVAIGGGWSYLKTMMPQPLPEPWFAPRWTGVTASERRAFLSVSIPK